MMANAPASSTTREPSSLSEQVQAKLARQREFFASGETRYLKFRRTQLQRLKATLEAAADDLYAALAADLGKCKTEAFVSEVALLLSDIDYALKHLLRWSKPRPVSIPLPLHLASGQVIPEPLGVVLIISPWNYPLHLAMGPLVSAIAAGNCAIIKPSEMAPCTSRLVAQLISKTFSEQFVTVMTGDAAVSQALLAEPFDHIFFTGSPQIGKIVMRSAAEHLTPVTLELGAKSPCVVTASANLQVAARRIVWGKAFNAGQTCVAPDYLLVQREVKADLMRAIAQTIQAFYGEDMAKSPDYGRIVSDRHFRRLLSMMTEALNAGKRISGGQSDAASRYLELTVIDEVPLTAAVMQEEIFGPILPVVGFDELESAIAFINERPKPLALYLFSTDKQAQKAMQAQTSSGGLCFNDVITQYAILGLPFGGVGQSGMGKAHGKAGFETFSHYKSIMGKTNWPDLSLRYPPYENKLPILKKLL